MRECMTRSPHTVTGDMPLGAAREILREHRIRHLPVVDGGKLVGILSDRNLMQALASPGGEHFLVKDAMLPEVFAVSPDTELSRVLEEMAEEKYGCAVVRENDGTVLGIFSTVDACRLLARLLADQKARRG